MKKKTILIISLVSVLVLAAAGVWCLYLDSKASMPNFVEKRRAGKDVNRHKEGKYYVEEHYTNKISDGKNRIQAIVLHHTASRVNTRQTVKQMLYGKKEASCHVLIDYDGTRFLIARPEQISWHAGQSYLNGRNNVNSFSIGVEFQGNTIDKPLTDKQIDSAIDYLMPLIKKYNIPISNIVTHEQVRTAWLKRNPESAKSVPEKPDITTKEHQRFLTVLKKRLKK